MGTDCENTLLYFACFGKRSEIFVKRHYCCFVAGHHSPSGLAQWQWVELSLQPKQEMEYSGCCFIVGWLLVEY